MIEIQLIKKHLSEPEGGNTTEYKELSETIIGCAYRVYDPNGVWVSWKCISKIFDYRTAESRPGYGMRKAHHS